MDPIEAFGRSVEGLTGPFLTDGWRWANTRFQLVAHRAKGADAPDRAVARVSALLGADLGEREYDVSLLRSFCEAHMPAAVTCEACGGSGRKRRACHYCDHAHDCGCDCDAGVYRRHDEGSVVGVGGVAFRAGYFLPIVFWLQGLGVSSVRVARVANVTAAYDGPGLVVGTESYRAVITSVSQEVVPLLVPCAEEHGQ